jgi:hypothetical protein
MIGDVARTHAGEFGPGSRLHDQLAHDAEYESVGT